MEKNKRDSKGDRNGYWEFNHMNGYIYNCGYYANNRRTGLWTLYNKNGKITKHSYFIR